MANESRFTGRAEVYSAYRPSYPSEIVQLIIKQVQASGKRNDECMIADIGAGTGKFTTLLLEQGFQVIAVEPNPDMLVKLKQLQVTYPTTLTIQYASAEQTGLTKASIDIIVCAQAFHWFDEVTVKKEWTSLLKENGLVYLIWNQRQIDGSRFMREYEQLFLNIDGSTKHGKQYKLYKEVGHQYMSSEYLTTFFGQKPQVFQINYEQKLDQQGLIGRILSSSYSLSSGDEEYPIFYEQIKVLYKRNEHDGYVSMLYETTCYYGTLI